MTVDASDHTFTCTNTCPSLHGHLHVIVIRSILYPVYTLKTDGRKMSIVAREVSASFRIGVLAPLLCGAFHLSREQFDALTVLFDAATGLAYGTVTVLTAQAAARVVHPRTLCHEGHTCRRLEARGRPVPPVLSQYFWSTAFDSGKSPD